MRRRDFTASGLAGPAEKGVRSSAGEGGGNHHAGPIPACIVCGNRGGEPAAAMYTLIVTAKLNDIDPQARRADVLVLLAELPHTLVHELAPWNWKAARHHTLAA